MLKQLDLACMAISLMIALSLWAVTIGHINSNDLSPDEVYTLRTIELSGKTPYFVPEFSHSYQELVDRDNHWPWQRIKGIWDVMSSAGETHPPFDYTLKSFWYGLFGTSIYSIRGMSIITSLMAVVFGFMLCRSLSGFQAGLLAALFMISSFHFLEYSIVARMHSTSLMLISGTLYFFYRYYSKDTGRSSLFFLSLFLACSSIHSFLFITPMVILFTWSLSWREVPLRSRILPWLPSLVVFGFYFIGWGYEQVQNINTTSFSQESHSFFAPLSWMLYGENSLFRFLPFFSSARLLPWAIQGVLSCSLLIFVVWRGNKNIWGGRWLVAIIIGAYLFDSLTGAQSTAWAHGRATNYILIPLVLILCLSLSAVRRGIVGPLVLVLSLYNIQHVYPMLNDHLDYGKGSARDVLKSKYLSKESFKMASVFTTHKPEAITRFSYYFQEIEGRTYFLADNKWDEVEEYVYPALSRESYDYILFVETLIFPLVSHRQHWLNFLAERGYELADDGTIFTYWGDFDDHQWFLYKRKTPRP